MRRAPRISRLVWLLTLPLVLSVANCTKRDALLDVTPEELNFGTQLDSLTLSVANTSEDNALTSGVTTLEYQMTVDVEWLTVSPPSGSCP